MDYSAKKRDIIVRNYPPAWSKMELAQYLSEHHIGTASHIKLLKGHAFVRFDESNYRVLSKGATCSELTFELARELIAPQRRIVVDEQKEEHRVKREMVVTAVAWSNEGRLTVNVIEPDMWLVMADNERVLAKRTRPAQLKRFPPPDQTFLIERLIKGTSRNLHRVRIQAVKSVNKARACLVDLGTMIELELDELLTIDNEPLLDKIDPMSTKLALHKLEKPFSSDSDERSIAKISAVLVPFDTYFVGYVGLDRSGSINCTINDQAGNCLNEQLLELSLCTRHNTVIGNNTAITASNRALMTRDKAIKGARVDENEKITIHRVHVRETQIELTLSLDKYVESMKTVNDLSARLWRGGGDEFDVNDLVLFKWKRLYLRGRVESITPELSVTAIDMGKSMTVVDALDLCQMPDELKVYPSPILKRWLHCSENVEEKAKIVNNYLKTSVTVQLTDQTVHIPALSRFLH